MSRGDSQAASRRGRDLALRERRAKDGGGVAAAAGGGGLLRSVCDFHSYAGLGRPAVG